MKHLGQYFMGAATGFLLVGIYSFSQSPRPAASAGEKKMHRIVFQITTPDTAAYRSLTRQINNVLAQWPKAQIEVVAHNKGIGFLEKNTSNVPTQLAALKARGVQFVACEHTMKQMKLEKTDILPEAGFVGSGLVEIIEKQEQGWAYIKGGF